MNRRTFIKAGLIGGTLWTLGGVTPWTLDLSAVEEGELLKGLPIWDAHAHPESFFTGDFDSTTPTLAMMKELNMAVCVAAAVGDHVHIRSRGTGGFSPKLDTERQLSLVKGWARDGKIRIIKTVEDLDRLKTGELGMIVGIEGGDALEGRLENLDYFYEEYAVRLITLLHDRNNEIGAHQRAILREEGLTPFGRNLVERMNHLGIIVDVAHAQTNTLRDVTALTSKPVVDSHTSFMAKARPFSRMRTFEEMECVAKTGGVVCTWPLSHANRTTLADWAREIILIKARLDITHVGLGTDGGGRLPKTVGGYKNIMDVGKLVRAMMDAGLDRADIRAFLGGNFERVVRANLKSK